MTDTLNRHELVKEADNGDELLLTCPQCDRRVVLHLRRPDALTVLNRGDFYALHHYGQPAMTVKASYKGAST